jgi:Mg2+ and Co2+ transporter CorA
LDQTSLDAITLHIEDAIIDALQEMLDAVQAAIEEARERQEQAENEQQQQQGGEMGEEPLIQLLAELRMIRSMQRRVNERTTRYDDEIKQLLDKPEVDWEPFKQAVEELARQENRISRILHELKVGKTQ